MKVTNTIEVGAWLEPEHIDIYLYLTPEQGDPFEFKVPYQDLVDNLVESHTFPHSGKMDPAGIKELEDMATTLDRLAVMFRARASEFKEKANEF